MTDANVDRVIAKLRQREAKGMEKYGVDTSRPDLDFVAWLAHLQEELLDAVVYIEAALQRPMSEGPTPAPIRPRPVDPSRAQ